MIYVSDITKVSKLFSIFFLNVDSNDNDPDNEVFYTAYPELRFNSRFPQIKDTMNEHEGIFTMCEVLTDVKPILSSYFSNREGYKVEYTKYNQSESSLNYMIAWPHERYDCKLLEQVYLTENRTSLTSNIRELVSTQYAIEYGLGEEYERSVPLYLLTHRDTKKSIILGIIHLGLSNEHRNMVSRVVRELVMTYRHRLNLNYPIFITGGWNGFDSNSNVDRYNEGQFSSLGSSYISLKDLVSSGCISTFNAFPNNIQRFMRHKEKAEEIDIKDQLRNAIKEDDTELVTELVTKLRELHTKVINQAEREPDSKVNLNGVVEHVLSQDIRKGLILDVTVGWNLSENGLVAYSRCLESKGESDHNPVVLTVGKYV
jgi:hypothetical protein